ncbi:MAG TPA: YibE/F family protein [Candidatus Dojkabacteria bacterium]|nr:YibE/F family protein [Candidatus Dojkabacteria bacterium]HRP51293.1 YibE/F family protein [Candidatus Dojkabacteria bacterium]
MKKLFLLTILVTLLFLGFTNKSISYAQDPSLEDETTMKDFTIQPEPEIPETEYFKGTVTEILEEELVEYIDGEQMYQRLLITITNGDFKGEKVEVENGSTASLQEIIYEVGDTVYLSYTRDQNGKALFFITDFDRSNGLAVLFLGFVLLTLLIGFKRGALSILSLIISFAIIFIFVLPQIQAGKDPVLVAILSSIVIIPITFYLSHGFQLKTTISIVGTFISLVITGLLAVYFVNLVNLTGGASEEALFLQNIGGTIYNLRDLLLAGIIIGTMGVMDDVTVSQTSIVFQHYDLKKKITFSELFSRSIKVGKDHISSMVNTLVLVYTGASMPLLLLFMNNPRPFEELLSYELVATEIVRMLVGSIGLIIAVPITTALACYVVTKYKIKFEDETELHHQH